MHICKLYLCKHLQRLSWQIFKIDEITTEFMPPVRAIDPLVPNPHHCVLSSCRIVWPLFLCASSSSIPTSVSELVPAQGLVPATIPASIELHTIILSHLPAIDMAAWLSFYRGRSLPLLTFHPSLQLRPRLTSGLLPYATWSEARSWRWNVRWPSLEIHTF